MLEVLGGDGAGVVERGGGQGVVGDPVDEPGQPARALEQGFDGGGFEQGELAAGQTQAVGEVGVEFVAVESIEVATPAGWASWTTSMGREGGASGSYRKVTVWPRSTASTS